VNAGTCTSFLISSFDEVVQVTHLFTYLVRPHRGDALNLSVSGYENDERTQSVC